MHRLRIFGAVLCLVAVLTFVVVHTPPVRRFAAQQVVALLARERIEFNTDELGYNLLNASVNLRNVRIRSTTWPDAPVFATIGRLRVNMNLLQLLRGRYVVQSGSAEDVQVHYVVDEQGRDNVPRPPSDPNEPKKPLDYLVQSLTVSNARVHYENRGQQIDAQLPLPSIEVTGNDVTDRHLVRLDARGGEVRVQDRRAAIDRLTGQVDVGKDDASIVQMHLDAVGSQSDLTGSIAQFDAPVLDLTLKSTVDASRVAEVAKLADPVSGSVVIDAAAKGPASAPAVDAHITGSQLQFRELRDAQLEASGAYDVATKRADVASFALRGPWGNVKGSGNVAADGTGQSRVNASVDGVDVATIMRALRSPYITATRIDGTVRAEWPGVEYLKASGDGDLRFTATAPRPSKSIMPVSGRVLVRATGGRIDTEIQRVTAANADVSGRVSITDDRRVQGAVKAHAGNLTAVVASAEAFLGRPQGSLLPTTVAGAADVDTRLGGTLDAPSAATTVNAPALTVGTLDGVAVTAQTTYTPAAVDITRADVTWKEAHAHVDGRVGLMGVRPLDLKLSADQFDVSSILQAVNHGDVPATGVFSARGQVGGTLDRPAATLSAQGTGLAAYEEPIGTLTANARLDGRQVALTDAVIDKPQPDGAGRITASGSYHLDRKTYTADVKSDNVTLVGLVLPNGQRVRGDVALTAQGAGTLSSPEGTIDLNAADLQLNDAPLGRFVVHGVAKNNAATITTSAEQFKLDANAVVKLMRPWPATVKVRADNLDLASIPGNVRPQQPTSEETPAPIVPRPLEGQIRATLDANLNLAEPEAGRATLALDAFEGKWNGRPFTVTSSSPIEYADQRLTLAELKVGASDATLTLSGDLPLTDQARAGAINVDLQGNLITVSQYLPPGTDLALDGKVAMTGSLKGTLKRIDPDLQLTVDNGLVLSTTLEPGFSDIQLKARVADGEARVDQLTGNWGTATFEATGRIPLAVMPALPVEIPRQDGAATFKAAVKGLDPASIPGAPSGTSGRISVEADVSAKQPTLAALDGKITFQDLDVSVTGVGLAQQQPSTITIASGTANIQQLELSGTAGTLKAGGRVQLVADRTIDVTVDGNLNLGAVSVVTKRVRADGDSMVNVRARGTVNAPEVTGAIDIKNANFVSDNPNVAGENLNAHIDLEGKRIVLANLQSDLNGGTLSGSGNLTLGEGGISDIDMRFATKDVAYDAPLDLRSISHADIRITRRQNDFVVGGQVTIDEAGLTGDINFDQGLLAAMTARRKLDLTEQRNPTLERIRFNVNVDTASPILVDNNLARAEIESDLRVVGTPYEPGLLGELRLLEGSEIRLNERRYEAEPSVINFVDERRIFPSFDLHLTTTASNYEISIAVTGTPGDTETTLTSTPSLPEPDIMAMLVTGRTLDQMRGEEYEVAREQVLSYLAGRLGSQLGRGLQQATGLSEVRVEPTLIANETDPGARLTVGQDLTNELKLVYSTNLADSNDQIWLAEYDVTRRFQTRGVRQSDNSYRLDFHHDVRFGGLPEPRRTVREQPKVAAVTVEATDGADQSQVLEKFGIKRGDKYDFFKIRNGIQHVEEALMAEGYLQSRVRLERRVEGMEAQLTLRVTRGPKVDVAFTGAMLPAKVQQDVKTQWHRGVFDKQRGDDGVDAIREWLLEDNHLQPKVEYRVQDSEGTRHVEFTIDPGMRSEKIVLAFEGASGISPDVLDKIVEQQKLERKLFTDPVVVTELLQRYYREQGYLVTEIDEPRPVFDGPIARVVLTVREGPKFSVRHVTTSGTNVIKADAMKSQLPVVEGQPFLPIAAENSLEKIRDLYWKRGYNDVRSDYSLVLDRGAGQVDVAFKVNEGRQSVIADIRIAGLDRVSEHLVREQLQLQQGQPLDLSALARSRRNLYDSGAFSVVDITRRERRGLGPDPAVAPDQRPILVNVNIREVQPVQMRYGASYDTERGIGGIFDISNKNSLGGAREIGLRSRYDKQLREARVYLNQPALKYLPKTTGSIYLRQELNPPTEITDPFDMNRRGFSIQSEQRLRNAYVLNYGYRLERARTLTPLGSTVIDEALTVSPVTATLSRESRDEVLDATRGAFVSQAFSYSPGWLGSDQPYIKYFGQYFKYIPLEPARRKPFTNEILRPRFVYAGAVRLGLGRGLGSPMPRTERFFAGGSATLRGFGQNAVGPIGVDRIPFGGEAMLVINNEVRHPLMSIVDGVVFADVGNVFNSVRNFSFTDIRKSAGVGLRLRTPWVLLRGDYGFILDRRDGEPRGRFYFSIGQAF